MITNKIEALLFAAGKPMDKTKLQKVAGVSDSEFADSLKAVAAHLNVDESGIRLFESEKDVALVTDPEVSDIVREHLRKDVMGELTKPSVETLAIIAYRGPVTKPEIEQIRGVNCTLILRNLMIRGLIDELKEGKAPEKYSVSMEYLKHLGVPTTAELPDYEDLHKHQMLDALQKQTQ
ncbi:SMC-Scp complex subunit ScpB [Candidatus Uhrbacteria bacterium]|jgi:segregation and condensation protein B|nr:SMC-Scp complex subunit ScpB [Candidatus Uhrbacteria bacterium]